MSYQEYRVNIANPSVRRASDKADAILNNFDNTGFAPVSRSLNRVEYNIIGSLGVTHRTVAQRTGERVTASCTCSATRICYHGLMAVKMLPRIVRTVTIDNSREAIMKRGRIADEQLFGDCGEWAMHADDYAEGRMLVAAGHMDEPDYFQCPGGCGYSIGDCHCR